MYDVSVARREAQVSAELLAHASLFVGWRLLDSNGPHAELHENVLWADRNVLTVSGSSGDSDAYLITFPDLASFAIHFAKRTIRVHWVASNFNRNTLRHLLVDQVLPRLLARDGSLVIHAAGVVRSSEAILLVGDSGRGKSTLAASFHVNGYSLLGDDAMVLDVAEGAAACRPLYRSLRLFPDSLAAIFETPRAATPVADYTDKSNVIDLEEADARDPRPKVHSIWCLAASDSDSINVREMPHAQACMAILEQSFALDPGDRDRSQLRLNQTAALVSRVPVFELAYRRDYAVLPEVRRAILAGQSDAR